MNFFRSDIYENLVMALDTLRGNKLRSFLTVVGVIIGVVTVMAISSIISGIDLAVRKEVESFGTRSIFLYKFDPGIHTSRPTREERTRNRNAIGEHLRIIAALKERDRDEAHRTAIAHLVTSKETLVSSLRVNNLV